MKLYQVKIEDDGVEWVGTQVEARSKMRIKQAAFKQEHGYTPGAAWCEVEVPTKKAELLS